MEPAAFCGDELDGVALWLVDYPGSYGCWCGDFREADQAQTQGVRQSKKGVRKNMDGMNFPPIFYHAFLRNRPKNAASLF